MRVGIDATLLRAETLYTGMGQYTRSLISALASCSKDHEFVLLGYRPRPPGLPEPLVWQVMRQLPLGKPGPWLSHQVVLGTVAHRLQLDVLHIPGVNLRLSAPGVPLWAPCPLVVTMHDVIPLLYYGRMGPPLPWRLRLGYRLALVAVCRAAAVITVSETSRHDILKSTGVPPGRLHVIHNGVDFPSAPTPKEATAILARLGIERPYALYAGSYEPRKNLLGAVAGYRHALARRALPPMVLLVERESGWRNSTMEAVGRSGVADHLHFLHSLSDEEMAALFHNASLFIYPSFYEGFGLPPVQALACGVPVIAARSGSLPEVLGDAAYFVDAASPEEIGEAIARLIEDQALVRELAARGPVQASLYRWERAARETVRVYEAAARSSDE